jgi:hypothetical protein
MVKQMSVREPARHALYSELQHVLGPEHAETLMTYLPQNRSEDVATKADITRLEARFDRLEDIVRDQQKFYVVTVVGSMTVLTGIFALVIGFVS